MVVKDFLEFIEFKGCVRHAWTKNIADMSFNIESSKAKLGEDPSRSCQIVEKEVKP